MPRRRDPDPETPTPATPTTPDPHAAANAKPPGRDSAARPRDPAPPPLPRAPAPPRRPTPGRSRRSGPARPGRRAEAPSETALTNRLEKIPRELTPAPLPPSPAAADAERWFEQLPTNPGAPAALTSTTRQIMRTPSRGSPLAPAPPERARPWLLPLLIAATALAVGMVLGALLFSHRGDASHCAPCAADKP
jgi:hypothetical protein